MVNIDTYLCRHCQIIRKEVSYLIVVLIVTDLPFGSSIVPGHKYAVGAVLGQRLNLNLIQGSEAGHGFVAGLLCRRRGQEVPIILMKINHLILIAMMRMA